MNFYIYPDQSHTYSYLKNYHFENNPTPPPDFLFPAFNPIFLASCSATRKTQQRINTTLETSPVFKKGFAGLAIYNPLKGDFLYAHNEEKYFTPASNTKLFTFYTGLKILGDSVPALRYTIKADSLIFTGTGDPSFLNPELPDSNVLSFLKNSGKELFYLPPVYTEKHLGPGWAWDDYDAYYSAERTDFPLYGNLVNFKFKKGDTIPQVFPEIFKDSLSIQKSFAEKNDNISRAIENNTFYFQNFPRIEEDEQDIPLKFSSELLAAVLTDTLQQKVQILKERPEQFQLNKKLYSIPTDSIYKRMLEVSDNFIAEQILLMASNEIADTLKSKIAIDYMKENYLQDLPDEPMWHDGSGLSRYNLFTPRTMVKLLEKILAEVPQEKLFSMMATGGKSGTLENYYKAEEPYIFAKTGTLRNNHSLSGYLKTNSGKILIFSFMNSNYTVPTSQLKQEMEHILRFIRDNY
ncbi:D-alanyl-D-alanine carboxypeptidase [Zunongwangia sp. F363]|uniref:D-alanyl-D-alanine carboxypeptidase n=1 Tax=Autumnicola tepida TaxID=3075595 RepID=A0ABU3C7V9_9FLAO|nr:D-alanyl-D-alanine carboxypeptidase [Zunongwangia sp. F363]MDT0642404.1 D-alanyl-D-alanine carboxypeptidase [Zunongwangia sp. F363]